MFKLSSIRSYFKKHSNNKKRILLTTVSVLAVAVFFYVGYVLAAPSIELVDEPEVVSRNVPILIASSTAETGDTIESAFYEIYEYDGGSATGSGNQCQAINGTTFGDNHVEIKCEAATISDGEYIMRITVIDNNDDSDFLETGPFIVDRGAPMVSYDDLPNAPNPINFDNPNFSGDATDSLTNIVEIAYATKLASSSDSIEELASSSYTICPGTYDAQSVSFECDPGTFADSIKGDVYRMYIRATDEAGNVSSFSNVYNFNVDTVYPYNLANISPPLPNIVYTGENQNINWDTPIDDYELDSNPIKIELSEDGGNNYTHVLTPSSQVGKTSPYVWSVDYDQRTDENQAVLKITAYDLAGNSVVVTSSPFTILSKTSPDLTIHPIEFQFPAYDYDATSTAPVNIKATAIDDQGGVSRATYNFSGGTSDSGSCVLNGTSDDGTWGEGSFFLDCGSFSSSQLDQGENDITVTAYDDTESRSTSDSYTFIYDTTVPSINISSIGTINTSKRVNATIYDVHTDIGYISWSSSDPEVTILDASSTNPTVSASSPGTYTISVEADDILGNSNTENATFTWTNSSIPGNFNIDEPSGDEILSGHVTYGEDFVIEWTNPGGSLLDDFDIEYYNGSSWEYIDNVVDNGNFQQDYTWHLGNGSFDDVNTDIARVRIIAQYSDSSDLTATSSEFTIDSTIPDISAGDLPSDGDTVSIMSSSTEPGATASDSLSGIKSISWTTDSGPDNIIFTDSTAPNPGISGTITGTYVAKMEVIDEADNVAISTVEFNWDGYPPDFSILRPEGEEIFAGDNIEPIIWVESDSAEYYNLYYSTDNWVSSTTIDTNVDGTATSTGLYYDWPVPVIDSETVQVRVVGVDNIGNEGTVTSNTFGIDSTDPIVDAGMYYNVVLGPTQPGASSSDVWSGIETYSWTKDDGPGTLEFTDGAGNPAADDPNPHIYADVPGVYVARLTVTDYAGNSASDTVALITNTNPPTVVITAPGKDVHWKGGTNKNIQWDLNTDPGNLTDFEVAYSIDDGSSWTNISTTVASTSRLLNWDVPMENSSTSVMRVITNNAEGETATATQEFIIDSEAPVITPGTLASTTVATTTGTVIVDNIDSENDVSYLWSVASSPSGGQIVFSPSHTVMDPEISGTVTGEYIIQVIAQDQAGNLSTDYIGDDGFIYWNGDPGVITVTSPSSTTIVPGDIDYTIEWYLEDPGDLTTFDIDYSLDGISWNSVATGVSSTSRDYLWHIPAGLNSTSSVVRVIAYDEDSNTSIGTSANFTIDSTAPVVDTGTMPTPISSASSSEGVTTIDNFDSLEHLDNQWTESSLPHPQAILSIASSTNLDTEFSGDMSGWYDVLLTSTDRAGNVGTSTLSFYWMSEYDPYITYPTEGVHLPGGETSTATWELINSGDLSHIEAHYSVDGGSAWTLVNDNIASTSLEVDWQVPDSTNSTSSLFRIYTVDDLGRHATATSQLFTIDSEDPYVDAGGYSDYLNNATAPGATSSDNLTAFEDLIFSWSKVSGVGDINFSDSSALNPSISATRNGDYVARLTATDKAGNTSSDTVSFERKISSRPGGPTTTWCSSVEYGPWEDCIDGVQHREIIDYDPAFCTPTSAQLAAEERSCTALETCSSVTYSDWGACINGYQTRTVIDRYPESCVLSEAQDASLTQTCDSGDNNQDDPNQVMEDARANVGEIDQSLVDRLKGQILIQVEDLGRAWYVNVDDGARYYLGRPRNAFTVMSMIGKGIKNELLKKLPVGLLDSKLSNDSDSDGDGLTDRLEEGLETDFFNSDSDSDGFNDYEEVMNGYDPLNAKATKSIIDNNLLQANLGQIFIQVETNGEAWYVEPKTEKRYYLGRPLEAFNVMRQFGVGITNEDINKIPVGEFSEEQKQKITNMLEERKRELEMAE